MKNDVLVVLSNPIDEDSDQEFNDWYTVKHLPEVLNVPGIVAAQRFKLSAEQLPEDFPPSHHRYLAIYEIDRSPGEIFDALRAGVEDGRINMSPAIDVPDVGTWAFSPLTDLVRASA